MVLTTGQLLDPADLASIRDAFRQWCEAQPPEVLIVPDAELVRLVDVELQLPEGGQ
jgi:hypothetical protein